MLGTILTVHVHHMLHIRRKTGWLYLDNVLDIKHHLKSLKLSIGCQTNLMPKQQPKQRDITMQVRLGDFGEIITKLTILSSYILCETLYKRNEWCYNHHCACTNILTGIEFALCLFIYMLFSKLLTFEIIDLYFKLISFFCLFLVI